MILSSKLGYFEAALGYGLILKTRILSSFIPILLDSVIYLPIKFT